MTRRIALGIAAIVTGIGLTILAVLMYPDPVSGDPERVETALAPLSTPPSTTASTTTISEAKPEPAWQRFVVEPSAEFDDAAVQPVGLRIEQIGVDAPIKPFGVNAQSGEMDVPRNVREVAWYKYGPAPGQNGSAVLAAHVDLSDQGRGVFFDLKNLTEGDRIFVSFDNGVETEFRVLARTTYAKDELPIDSIFSRSGPPVLTLITCGGGFNEAVGRYDSNVVVYAAAIDDPPLPNNPSIN